MYRTIDTCIWDDPWVSELEPLDKLLFVYLMTNRRSTPCGAFEITLKQISFETGLSQEQARRMLPKMAPKVMWWGEHQIVWVRNFYKHQRANSNATTFAAAAAKKLQDFPPAVRRVVIDEYPELTTEGDDLNTVGDTLPPPTSLPIPTVGGKETVTVTVKETVAEAEEVRAPAFDFSTYFDTLWQRYPAREGDKIGKGKMEALVRVLPPAEWPLLMKAVINYANSGRMPVDPPRFLKSREFPNGMWREYVNKGANNGANQQGSTPSAISAQAGPNRTGLRDILEKRGQQAQGA
jgi:hypothetical protein